MTATIHTGDAVAVLRTLPANSVHCCVTSPPYWGLRDYGIAGQIINPEFAVMARNRITADMPLFAKVRGGEA